MQPVIPDAQQQKWRVDQGLACLIQCHAQGYSYGIMSCVIPLFPVVDFPLLWCKFAASPESHGETYAECELKVCAAVS
jgi:hypothetical protein